MSEGDETSADRRDGRGRLSSIDLLPDEAEEDIIWANEQLRERRAHSVVILVELNDRLREKGIGPISKSAWGRYAVRKAIQFRKLDEARRMSAELVSQLGPEGADEVTVAVAEMLKLAILELLEGGKLSTKGVMELSRALQSSIGAQKVSAEHRRKLEEEIDRRLKKAADAVAEAGAKSGVSEDALKKITSLLTTGAY
mgnify:FL=1